MMVEVFRPPASVSLDLRFDPPPKHKDLPREILRLRLGDTPDGKPWGVERIAEHLDCAPETVRKYLRSMKRQLAAGTEEKI